MGLAQTAPSPPGSFDFELSAAQETRARDLFARAHVADMMNLQPGGSQIYADIDPAHIRRALENPNPLERLFATSLIPYRLALSGQSDLMQRWWRQTGISCGTLGLPGIQDELLALSTQAFDREYYPGLPWLRPALTVSDIRAAKKAGGQALVAYCQPTVPLPRDLKQIEKAHSQGLRWLMLTYNRMDHVGVGCTERVDAGLSLFGVEVVTLCNSLGVMIDTSHCGRATTLDACRTSKSPVSANHTCAGAIYAHARAKSDEELRAIAGTGGMIGICAVPYFLSADAQPSMEHMLDHIDYVVDLVGVRHVGIGTDWPFQAPRSVLDAMLGGFLAEAGFRAEDKVDTQLNLLGFEDGRDMINIARGLVKRGYADEDVCAILGDNFLRHFETVCG